VCVCVQRERESGRGKFNCPAYFNCPGYFNCPNTLE
jgi:hypothetical protein